MIRGRVFNLQRFATHDGPGIRTTVFLKGCPLACPWCHNPEGMRSDPELSVHPSLCIECRACVSACPHGIAVPATIGRGLEPGLATCALCGGCADVCPTGAREIVGTDYSVDELIAAVSRDRVFYEESGGGVTFSGGEPLQQADFVLASLEACRDSGLHTALDTCGLIDPADLAAAAERTDLVLFDLKVLDRDRHREVTGAANDTILSNLAQLASADVPVWLRIPLVPGVNDADVELAGMARLAAGIRAVQRVHLLPYHRLGRDRRERLGLPLLDPDPGPPHAGRLREAAAIFERAGLDTYIGG